MTALHLTDIGGLTGSPGRPRPSGNWRSMLSSLIIQTEANLVTPSYEFGAKSQPVDAFGQISRPQTLLESYRGAHVAEPPSPAAPREEDVGMTFDVTTQGPGDSAAPPHTPHTPHDPFGPALAAETRVAQIEADVRRLEGTVTGTDQLRQEVGEVRADARAAAERERVQAQTLDGTVEALARVEARVRRLRRRVKHGDRGVEIDGLGGRLATLEARLETIEAGQGGNEEEMEEREAQAGAVTALHERIMAMGDDVAQLQQSMTTAQMVLKDLVAEMTDRDL